MILISKLEDILISGCSGFVGSNLIPKICNEKRKVFAITTSKNKPKIFKKENIKWIFSENMDVPENILKSCDTLVHLASSGVNQDKKYELLDLFNSNVNNSYKLILNCLRNGFKRVIYIGSCFEYGQMANIKQDHLSVYDALMPLDQYSATKAALTTLLYPLSNYFNAEIRIIRAFNVYGPHEKENRLYPTLMRSIRNKEIVSITKGEQKKYFTPVEFLVDSIIEILRMKPKQNYFLLENLGGGKLLTVFEFAKYIFDKHNLKLEDYVRCDKNTRTGEPSIITPELNQKFISLGEK